MASGVCVCVVCVVCFIRHFLHVVSGMWFVLCVDWHVCMWQTMCCECGLCDIVAHVVCVACGVWQVVFDM